MSALYLVLSVLHLHCSNVLSFATCKKRGVDAVLTKTPNCPAFPSIRPLQLTFAEISILGTITVPLAPDCQMNKHSSQNSTRNTTNTTHRHTTHRLD
jgi:hypothetical protein